MVDPDGVAVQFVSDEGTFTTFGGPADGRISVDIGVAEGSSTPVGALAAAGRARLVVRGDDLGGGGAATHSAGRL